MNPLRIFISSVQKELAEERLALQTYLQGDALMRRFCEVFLFEDVPASNQPASQKYLDEVAKCDLYMGIFADQYGWEDSEGLSPTHREFRYATELGKQRLIYVKGASDTGKHPKMQALIAEAGTHLIRKRFGSTEELVTSVYASLVKIMEEREILRFTPFDATAARDAALNDLDMEKVTRFLGMARRGRSFPLAEDTPPVDVLAHLDLLSHGRPSHAAILLFGKKPQRFLITSEVKCAHFHGFVMEKPIPSYQVYKGTVFDMVDAAKDFVLSKIDLWTGDRSQGVQVPTAYEIPQEVVAEAIVNAVVHRDYTSNASVQVMLFKDRLEVWNPGALPANFTLEKLYKPHNSVPWNPLIAEPMYLTKYIERMGTGILDMFERCKQAGLPAPEIRLDMGNWILTIWRKKITPQVGVHDGVYVGAHDGVHDIPWTETMKSIIRTLQEPCSTPQLLAVLGYPRKTRNYETAISTLLQHKLIEMTLPDTPRSKNQKYRLTLLGRATLAQLEKPT